MKIEARAVRDFLNQPPEDIKIFLIHGPDKGLIHERTQSLLTSLKCSVQTLDYERLTSDYLLEQALNKSLFAEKLCLYIEQVDDHVTPLLMHLQPFLDASFPIVLMSCNLSAHSSLKKFCEGHARCAAIACYNEHQSQIRTFILQKMQKRTIQEGALDFLTELGQGQKHMLEQEIEKILLYKGHDLSAITKDEVQALCYHDKENMYDIFDRFLQALYHGKMREIQENWQLCSPHIGALLPMLSYHFQRLALAHKFLEEGKSHEEALEKLKPAVHFSQKNFFITQLKKWPFKKVRSILSDLFEAELAMRENKWVCLERLFLEWISG